MFEIHRTANGGYFWRLRSSTNGQTLCHSEAYTTKQAAIDGVNAAKRNMGGPTNDLT